MSNPTIGIDLELRLEKFKADMAQLPNISSKEGKAMAAQLSRELKAAERAARAAGEQSKKTKTEFGEMGDAAGKAGQSAAKMSGALSLVSPAAGDALRTLNDLADVGEVAAEMGEELGVSMAQVARVAGPVAVVVVALAAAYALLAADLKESEEAAARVTAALDVMIPVFEAVRQAKIDYRVATDQLTESEAAEIRTREKWNDVTGESISKLREQQALLAAEAAPGIIDQSAAFWGVKGAVDAYSEGVQNVLGPLAFLAVAWNSDADASKAAANEIEGLEHRIVSVTRAAEMGAEVDIEAARARDKKKAADEAAAGASQRRTEAERESTEAAKEAADAARDQAEAERELSAAFDAMVDRQLAAHSAVAAIAEQADALDDSDAERMEKSAQRMIDKLELQREISGESIALDTAEMQIRAQLANDLADVQRAAAMNAAEDEARIKDMTVTASADMFGQISSLAAQAGEDLTESQKAGAMAAWGVQLAAGTAQVALNSIRAISEAAALPYPINIPATIAAVAAGVAMEAAVLSVPPPSFNDTPRVQQIGTRQTMSFGAGDYVAAARNPADLKRQVDAVAGDGMGGRSEVSVVGTRAVGRTIREELRARTPLRRAIDQQAASTLGVRGRA